MPTSNQNALFVALTLTAFACSSQSETGSPGGSGGNTGGMGGDSVDQGNGGDGGLGGSDVAMGGSGGDDTALGGRPGEGGQAGMPAEGGAGGAQGGTGGSQGEMGGMGGTFDGKVTYRRAKNPDYSNFRIVTAGDRMFQVPTGTGPNDKFRALISTTYNAPTQWGPFRDGATDAAKLFRQFAYDNHIIITGGVRLQARSDDPGYRRLFNERIQPGLEALATELGHPELSSLNIITIGCSGDGARAQALTYGVPERAIGTVSYHGESPFEVWTDEPKTPQTRKWQIPFIHPAGGNDELRIPKQEILTRAVRRDAEGTMTRVLQPAHGHCQYDVETGQVFIVEWLQAVLDLRLDAQGKLRPIDKTKSWYGKYTVRQNAPGGAPWGGGTQFSAPEIHPYADVSQNLGDYIWLPSEKVAALWLAYTRDGVLPPLD